jgi:hypothetical protein
MAKVDDLRGRIPPEVEQRLDRAVENFRESHRHPANLAMHVAAIYFIAKGVFRVLRGRIFSGLTLIGMGVGLIAAGHQIEGSDAFALFRGSENGRAS